MPVRARNSVQVQCEAHAEGQCPGKGRDPKCACVAAGATEGIVRGSWDEEPPEPELEPEPAGGEACDDAAGDELEA